MSELRLDVHGIGVRVRTKDAFVLEELRRDFAFFETDGLLTDPIVLELRSAASSSIGTRGRILWRRVRYRVRDAGTTREIEYADGARAVYDYRQRAGWLACDRLERLRELAYLAVLSRVGEALDERGLHRVHALAFEAHGQGGLLLLPSGGGKSTIALELFRSTGIGFLAEDTALVDRDGVLRSFPLRWGFRPDVALDDVPDDRIRLLHRLEHGPKRLLDVSHVAARIRDRIPLRWLFLGSRSGRPAGTAPASTGALGAALAGAMVVGVGLAQMSEYTLRSSAAGKLASIAFSRARTALRLLSRSTAWRLELGPDARSAAAALCACIGMEPRRGQMLASPSSTNR